jgi:hypothetical protein
VPLREAVGYYDTLREDEEDEFAFLDDHDFTAGAGNVEDVREKQRELNEDEYREMMQQLIGEERDVDEYMANIKETAKQDRTAFEAQQAAKLGIELGEASPGRAMKKMNPLDAGAGDDLDADDLFADEDRDAKRQKVDNDGEEVDPFA